MDDIILVGDVGGTNGRLALIKNPQNSVPEIIHTKTLPSSQYPSLAVMIAAYLKQHPDIHITKARLAVCGPTTDRHGHLTNLNWTIDAGELEERLAIADVKFENDFGALARGVTLLHHNELRLVKSGESMDDAPISIMGPGTGFGVSLLVKRSDDYVVVKTEGGHMSFSPGTMLEQDLCSYLKARHDHVSVEMLLCGEGLARIHRFLVSYEGSGNPDMLPEEISAAAADGSVPSCIRAVQLFLSVLGTVAGDIALAHGARGGVYFGGGILPKIAQHIDSSDLIARFSNKGPMQEYLSHIPIHLIVSDKTALLGASQIP